MTYPPQQPPGSYPPAPPPGAYPPAGYSGQPNSGHPVQVFAPYPERQSRALAGLSIPFFLARYILLIPVFFCLYFVGIAAFVLAWLAMWTIALTGRNSEGFHNFCLGYLRWSTRASAYMLGVTDAYPGFSMQP